MQSQYIERNPKISFLLEIVMISLLAMILFLWAVPRIISGDNREAEARIPLGSEPGVDVTLADKF